MIYGEYAQETIGLYSIEDKILTIEILEIINRKDAY